MRLEDYKDLESTAAKNGAITVDAADLLTWREERERLRIELADHEVLKTNCTQYHREVERLRQVKIWARQAYPALVVIDMVGTIRAGGWSTRELVESAPDGVKS